MSERMFERKPEDLSAVVQRDRMFATNADGEPIAREQTCACGRRYVQRLLSERFLEIVERRGKRAMDTMLRDVPGFYVPVLCPACERRELGRMARAAMIRHDLSQPTPEAAD